MHGRFIRDLPLAQKVLIPPAMLLVVIVALGGHVQRTIGRYDDALRSMDVDVHRKGSLVDGVIIDVSVAQGRLYQLINWQSAGLEAARLEDLAARINAGLPRIAAQLSELDGLAGLSGPEREALRAAITEADGYVKAIAQVLEMALVDQSYAVMFMKAVDDGHAKLAATLGDLQERSAARSAEIFGGVRADSAQAVLVSIGAILLSLVLGTAVALVVSRMISRPIGAMTGAMQALSRGDLGVRVDFSGRRDEIGRMADALVVFQQAMRENTSLQARQRAEDAAREEQRRRLDEATNRFAETIDRLIRDVGGLADDMKGVAETMSCAAAQATGLSIQVSADTGRAAGTVTAVASATEQLSASISEITRQVKDSAALSRNAVELSKSSAGMVQTLADSANRISSIIDLIGQIAGQTNLLALNATIEAARAGDVGKGFAVVAGEVKALAKQTEHATDEITRQIASVQEDASGVIAVIASIGQTIQTMNGIAEVIAVSIEEQMAATQEISRSAQDISSNVSQVAEKIRRVEGATESTGQLSDHVLDATNTLTGRFNELRARVQTFVEQVHGERSATG